MVRYLLRVCRLVLLLTPEPFILYAFGASFAMAAIYRVSKSIWLCVLFHSATNALQGTWPLKVDYLIKGVTAGVLLTAAVGIVSLSAYLNKKERGGPIDV